jgi:excisionase family DNA binding protein
MDTWITTSEAAKLSQYSMEYIRRLMRNKKLKSRKFGVVWQVEKTSLLAYLHEGKQADDQRRGPRKHQLPRK